MAGWQRSAGLPDFKEYMYKILDYIEAIKALRKGMLQLEPDGKNCSICGDNDHQAFECHLNPLVAMEKADGYRCFHCGELFFGDAAREHFGKDENETVKCLKEKCDGLPD